MPKMRWDCSKKECFNKLKRPKIEMFDHCFPGRIAMGDIDGSVEINGHEIQLEWKDPGVSIPVGQDIKYKTLTAKNDLIVVVANGNAETMEVDSWQCYYKGKLKPKEETGLEGICDFFKRWSSWAKQQIDFPQEHT